MEVSVRFLMITSLLNPMSSHPYPERLDLLDQLHQAIREGELTKVKAMIEVDHVSLHGFSWNNGLSSLHFAVLSNQIFMVDYLAHQQGVDINVQRHGYPYSTALHLAADNRQTHMIELLLKLGAQPLIPDGDSALPIHISSRRGHIPSLKLFMENHSENPLLLLSDGDTCLHIASKHYHFECTAFLIEQGVPLDIKNHQQMTPLEQVKRQTPSAGRARMITYLEHVELVLSEKKELDAIVNQKFSLSLTPTSVTSDTTKIHSIRL